MLEYGLLAGAIAGAEGLFAAVLDGARQGAHSLLRLATDNPVVSLALLAGLLGWFLIRRQ